jgi:hypothetical protein
VCLASVATVSLHRSRDSTEVNNDRGCSASIILTGGVGNGDGNGDSEYDGCVDSQQHFRSLESMNVLRADNIVFVNIVVITIAYLIFVHRFVFVIVQHAVNMCSSIQAEQLLSFIDVMR